MTGAEDAGASAAGDVPEQPALERLAERLTELAAALEREDVEAEEATELAREAAELAAEAGAAIETARRQAAGGEDWEQGELR